MLKEKLQQDRIKFMKEKQKDSAETIKMVNSAIKNREISLRATENRELTDAEVVEVIGKEIKQYKETLVYAVQRGDEDTIALINASIELLSTYLPKQLTEDEAKAIIKETLAEQGITEKKQMGLAMKSVMPKLKGKFDGSKVKDLVLELLS